MGPVPSQRDDNHQEPLRHGEAQVQLVLVIVVIITFITIITLTFRLVVLRNKESLEQLSVKPISQYPLLLDDMVGHIIVFVLNDILIILSSSMTWPPTSLPSSPIIQIFAIINNNIVTIHVITIITNNIVISNITPDEKVLQIFESDEFKKFRAKRELRVHKGKLVMTNKNMMAMTKVVMLTTGCRVWAS